MQRKTDSFDLMKKKVFLLAFLPFLFFSCLRKDEFPNTPSITFKSITTTPDSAVILLDFVDGDGNFGITDADTTGIYDDCYERYNIYAEYYELRNGEWVWVQLDPCIEQIPWYYQVPFAEPTGQIKSQKGELRLLLEPTYYLTNAFDTCRFEIFIADRDRNLSNRVRTSVFYKPI
jgi:hypothetical protein